VGQRRALITGITGQDGSYLAEFLFERRLPRHRYGAPLLDRVVRADRPPPRADRHPRRRPARPALTRCGL